jgi:hypothetical protein
MLDQLKNIAFRIQIEPLTSIEKAPSVEMVIKVLTELTKSYKSFLEIEFNRNELFKKAAENNQKLVSTIIEDLKLLFVDLDFGSFEAALAPDLASEQYSLWDDDVLNWKQESFADFKSNIIEADYNDIEYQRTVAERYSEEERTLIFTPLFSSFGDGSEYRFHLKDQSNNIIKTFRKPESKIKFFTPKLESKVRRDQDEFQTIQVYARIRKNFKNEKKLTKSNVKEILYYEEVPFDTYPFKPDVIKFDKYHFHLDRKLDCSVQFMDEDNYYIISNELLGITVWGETRAETEEAFSFNFYALYDNYFNEPDERLSSKARELKFLLNEVIIKVEMHEGKEN